MNRKACNVHTFGPPCGLLVIGFKILWKKKKLIKTFANYTILLYDLWRTKQKEVSDKNALGTVL